MTKILVLFLASLFVTACAPYQGSLKERGLAAAARGDWEAAYRFSEDALMSDDAGKRTEARGFVLSNAKIYDAAGRTFHEVALLESLQKYGESNAYAIEHNRLLAYKTVARSHDYKIASDTFNRIFSEIRKKKEEQARDLARAESDRAAERAQREKNLFELEKNARIVCRNEVECRKVFALTEIFSAEHSDMKIQLSTGNIIETYNPTKPYNVGLKAIKTPLQGDSAEVALRVICASDARDEYCEKRKLSIYKAYPVFLKNKLID